MIASTRRQFLQTTAILLGSAIAGNSFDIKKRDPRLAFSTLGCPDWNFAQVMDFAVQNGYKGIEIRGILREMDLPKCPEFSTAANRTATLRSMEDKGLSFVDLGSSCTLHFAHGAERQKNLDEGRRFIDLADQIKCPYIRVFPNIFPKDQDKSATIDLITEGLLELGKHANGSKVSVLIESHGDLVRIDDLEKVMQAAAHDHVGMVWDITNMWTLTKEPPADAYKTLKKYIRHTHIKDAKMVDGKPQYKLLGQGEVPIFDAIDILRKGGYKGYFSFEWEKLWHPELEEPAIALANYPLAMKNHFAKGGAK